ncbi:diguanylate cyclase [Massilia sp. H6]|uniref:GGDEF domain-containing protein n=1 Tax=Massilia sp. H6 TaxID=2970464 RepID=UPI00216A9F09|nr:GGDEF domain-containing protein [Massilia sp. H6]UVW30069.1 GGDEF domain-containing protein [Massilia sp. H6]
MHIDVACSNERAIRVDGMSAVLHSAADLDLARATGFSECVITLRRALTTTPAGWILAVWFCWDIVPNTALFRWLGTAALVWAFSLWTLQDVIKKGSLLERHRTRLHLVAGLDGLAWGLMAWFLMGHSLVLDATLMALLCGVIAINAQAYATYPVAYYRQICTILAVSVVGLLIHVANQKSATDYAAGLTVFITLIAYYTHEMSKRLLEGFRLQRANASLAERLHLALQKVELDAATDALTGQGNRRALEEFLKQQESLYRSSGKPFSILMLDIDFFKAINDGHGHMTGDEVLRVFARRMVEYLRPTDFCARFGGEEFVVVLPGTAMIEAREVAERLRVNVAQAPLLEAPVIHVTVSIGVATFMPKQTLPDLLATADARVYTAKNAGRNQVHS